MAVVFDSAVGGSGYPPNGFTVDHTLGYGQGNDRMLVVFLLMVGGTYHALGSFQHNWSALNVPIVVQPASYFSRIMTMRMGFFLDSELPASAGTYSIYVNCGQAYDGVVGAISYVGVDQSTPPTVSSNGVGSPELSGTINTTTVETSSGGEMVDGFGCDMVAPGTLTPGTGQIERVDTQRANSTLGASDKTYPFTPHRMSQTPSGNFYAYGHIIAELAATGALPAGYHNAPIIGANF